MKHSSNGPAHRALKSYRWPIAGVAGALVLAGSVVALAPAQAAGKVVQSNLVDQSDTRSTGHNDFNANGTVHVFTSGATSTDKAAGYFDVDKSLASVAAVEPTMSWTATPGAASNPTNVRPGEQLKVDFNGDGTIDGTLVGEPTYADGTPLYGNDWWLSNGSAQFVKDAAPSHTGGSGSDNHGTLAQWRAAFPAAKVLQGGWSLGSGVKGDGTINNFVIAGTTYTFAPAPATTVKVLHPADVDLSQTRANGHNDFLLTGGVHIYTDGSTDTGPNGTGGTWNTDKAAGYFAVNLPLSQAGEPSQDYVSSLSNYKVGMQLVVDLDGDGAPDGILVGEPTYADGTVNYGNDWWLSSAASPQIAADAPNHSGGFGSANHGMLSEWRAKFPNATILAGGWSLGSGAFGAGTLNSMTIGTTKYTFVGVPANTAPTASPVTGSGPFQGGPVTVTLLGHDAEGDALTYTAGPLASSADGTLSAVNGNQVTFTPAYGFYGTETFPYTVKDAGHPAVSSTVTITIANPPVDPLLTVNATVTPGSNATKRTIVLDGTAAAPLPALGGFKVTDNGVARSGGSVTNRKYKLSLGPGNATGTHIYVVTYAGHSSTIVVHAN